MARTDDRAERPLRVAAFGFRSLPPKAGAAGADKFALELLPRLVALGCEVTAYNRIYPDDPTPPGEGEFCGVRTVGLRTVAGKGFDTLLHSAKATWRILWRDGADVVHIQNGGNSPFALLLRLFGKRAFVSQDGPDWLRDKWPWYAKLYLRLTQYLTAYGPTSIIFDNVFARDDFEKKFKRLYHFVPFGSEVDYDPAAETALERLGLERGRYILFVGRFIPDKGLHYLVPAFERTEAPDLKLVLVGGSPNPSPYEAGIRATTDPRIMMPGYIYGAEMHALMKNAMMYVQPSDVEGLSPVILESAYLGVPILCSDIVQNRFIMREHALYFQAGSTEDLQTQLKAAVSGETDLTAMAAAGQAHVRETYNWDSVARDHLAIFRGEKVPSAGDGDRPA
jgi:glycosyltransferase involved in cell wall biosynthesis